MGKDRGPVREYAVALGHGWWVYGAGVLIAVVGLVFDVADQSIPRSLWVALLCATATIAPITAFARVRGERDELRKEVAVLRQTPDKVQARVVRAVHQLRNQIFDIERKGSGITEAEAQDCYARAVALLSAAWVIETPRRALDEAIAKAMRTGGCGPAGIVAQILQILAEWENRARAAWVDLNPRFELMDKG